MTFIEPSKAQEPSQSFLMNVAFFTSFPVSSWWTDKRVSGSRWDFQAIDWK